MRVLMIEHFSPGNSYTYELGHYLCNLDDITLITKKNANLNKDELKQLPILYGESNNKVCALLMYVHGINRLKEELQSGGYNVVHVQTLKNAEIEIRLYVRLKKKGYRLVHTVHNILPHESTEKDRNRYGHFYDSCDALIVHNEESKRILIQNFPSVERRVYVIPHGVYTVSNKIIVQNAPLKKRFLMFGLVRRYKGVDIFIKAISMIPLEKRKTMEFIIAGRQYKNQDCTDYSKMIKDYDIENDVQFLQRRIDDEELDRLYSCTTACVFPYREIYGSGALLMAYAYHVPVIASDIPAFREETEAGRTGMLFEKDNPKALADAIVAMSELDESAYQQKKDSIKELAEIKYNWKLSAEKTHAVYQAVMD